MSAKRTLLLGVLIYGLVLAGLATLNRSLIAIAIPLALYLGATLVYRPAPLRLQVGRQLSNEFVASDRPVTVELTVRNKGEDLDEVRIEDVVPAGLEVTGETSVLTSLAAGESTTLSYVITGTRGAYRFRSVRVSAEDHFGLFRRAHSYGVESRLSVLPEVPRMRSVMIRPLRTRGFAGPILSGEGGSGTDFYGIREYQPGDPPRRINWRLSARHTRELFTNEFEQERIADVGLILDARERTDVHINGTSLFEHAVEATAALAGTFLSDGNRVGLLIYGRGLERTFPGYGKQQRQRILRALSRAQTGDSQVFGSLDYLPTRFFPAKSQLVLVSPLCADDPPVLTRLRARGYELLVISPNPIDFEARTLPSNTTKDLAVRIARDQRALWIHQLQRVGIVVVDWNIDRPLDTTVHGALRKVVRQVAPQIYE